MNKYVNFTATGTDAGCWAKVPPQNGKTPLLLAYRATSDDTSNFAIYVWNGLKTSVTTGAAAGAGAELTVADATIFASTSDLMLVLTPTGTSDVFWASDITDNVITADTNITIPANSVIFNLGATPDAQFVLGAATIQATASSGPCIMAGKRNGPMAAYVTASSSACSITTFSVAYVD